MGKARMTRSKEDLEKMKENVIRLWKTTDMSVRQLAARTGLNRETVYRTVKDIEVNEGIEKVKGKGL